MDGQQVTLTVKHVEVGFWDKPSSDQRWWTIVTNEHPSEPTKFIAKVNDPQPEVGKEYTGKQWGNKFYPNNGNASAGIHAAGGFRSQGGNAARARQDAAKQAEIKAEWAIGKALQSLGAGADLKDVEALAVKLFDMVTRMTHSAAATSTQPGTTAQTELVNKPAKKADREEEAEFQSMLAKGLEADGIDMSEIPF